MGKTNLQVIIGDDVDIEFHCEDDAGEPFDLTGSTIAFHVTQNGGASTLTLTVGVDAAITMPTPANGKVLLSLSDTVSALFMAGVQERFTLKRTISSKTSTLVYGRIQATDPDE